MSVVLDACALIAFLVNEEGADRIADLLINDDCYIHAANVYEVYYDMLERSSEQAANTYDHCNWLYAQERTRTGEFFSYVRYAWRLTRR